MMFFSSLQQKNYGLGYVDIFVVVFDDAADASDVADAFDSKKECSSGVFEHYYVPLYAHTVVVVAVGGLDVASSQFVRL